MNAVLAALAGGIIGLDATSFPQVMISRPLVAGALAGWLAGMPAEGAMLGAVLEAFHLAILPIGATRHPESGTAAAAAVFALAWAGGDAHGIGLLLAVTFALGWERLGGGSVNLLRHINEYIAPAGAAPAPSSTVTVRHTAALGLDFLRGAIVTLAGAGAGYLWIRVLGSVWIFEPATARGLAVASAAGCAAGLLKVLGGWSARWKLLAIGLIAGTIGVLA